MIIRDFLKAVGQLGDRRFQRVLWLGIGLTIALLVAIYAVVLWIIKLFTADGLTLPWIGEVTWIGDLLGWGSLGLILFMSVFLMVPVASAMTSLFLDDVADAVEAEHYPQFRQSPRTSFLDGLRDTLRFLGLLIGANILALFVYAFVFWIPFAPLILFWALNGFLLGREYFQLVAMRRLGRQGAKDLRKKHGREIWMAGCLMAMPLTIPLVNLVIPILGAATFTHLYHRIGVDRG